MILHWTIVVRTQPCPGVDHPLILPKLVGTTSLRLSDLSAARHLRLPDMHTLYFKDGVYWLFTYLREYTASQTCHPTIPRVEFATHELTCRAIQRERIGLLLV